MAVAGAIVQGMDFVRDQLTGFLPREATAIIRRATTRIAGQMRNEMRRAAPRHTGTLRKAIVSRRRRGSRDSIEASVEVTSGKGAKHDAFYWRYVEYGTQRSPAKPFAGPVIERHRATYRKDLGDEVGRQAVKQLKKRAKRQRLT
jgi:HK97 gp10 family phage protein